MKRKKRTPRKTKKAKKIDISTLSTDAKFHLVIWDAYTKPGFFGKLLQSREDSGTFALMLKGYGLTSEELTTVRESLKPDRVMVDPKHLIEGLRIFTAPKPKWTRDQLLKELVKGGHGPIWASWTVGPIHEGEVAK